MRIVCDACGAKYSIADQKVRGKTFKIRCKKCSNVILVKGKSGEGDEPAGDAGADASLSPATSDVEATSAVAGVESPASVAAATEQWFAVIDGAQAGPFAAAEIRQKIESGALTGETFAWKEGMSDWLKLDELSAFADALSSVAPSPSAAVPVPPTQDAEATSDGLFGAAAPLLKPSLRSRVRG